MGNKNGNNQFPKEIEQKLKELERKATGHKVSIELFLGGVKVTYGKGKNNTMIFPNNDMNKEKVLFLIERIETILGFEEHSGAWEEQREKLPHTITLESNDGER
jgi:hypothetical protein